MSKNNNLETCQFCGSYIGEYSGYCGAVCLTIDLKFKELYKYIDKILGESNVGKQ